MVETIKQTEAIPDEYPDLGSPSPLSNAAQALDQEALWQRLESFVAYRWTERDVEWIVEGCGEWVPPLQPATISAVERWTSNNSWEAITPDASPRGGYCLPGGTYRFTASVGGGTVPAAVLEAFRRLAEYTAARPMSQAGIASESVTAGSVSISRRMSPSAIGEGMANSGAGDLLRRYRRVS
ncbi:hypothetical protein AAFN47_20315 [Hoeflea sp. CAU 1731]